MSAHGLPLHYAAWTAAALIFASTHGSYLIAASYGHLEWCVPYWDSCTSISAAGRQLPEKIWFKLGMMPAALLALLLWCLARIWLLQGGLDEGERYMLAMPITGGAAALFLMLYVLALGEEGDAYQQLRRTGVVMSFTLTFVTQALFAQLLRALAEKREDPGLRRWYSRLLALLLIMLAIGLFSVLLEFLMGTAYDEVEDAFEWVLALLLNLYFVALGLLWRTRQVRIELSVR